MKYMFVINATITLGCEVEADTLAEAVEKAQNLGAIGLCHQCSSSRPNVWCTSGELDFGAPSECELVDFHGGHGEPWEAIEEAWCAVMGDEGEGGDK